MTAPESIDLFIARWQSAGGGERANYQLFITELCELLATLATLGRARQLEDGRWLG